MNLLNITRKVIQGDRPAEIVIHSLSYHLALIAKLHLAFSSIEICAYVIKGNLKKHADPVSEILHVLEAKAAQGVSVRVILDRPKLNRPNFHTNRFFMRRLYDSGIPFGVPTDLTVCHSKAICIDQRILFVGSHNLTKRSFLNPLELTAEIRAAGVASEYSALFDLIWSRGNLKKYPPSEMNFERIYP